MTLPMTQCSTQVAHLYYQPQVNRGLLQITQLLGVM